LIFSHTSAGTPAWPAGVPQALDRQPVAPTARGLAVVLLIASREMI
jgi:hypothetical protein